MKERNPNDQDVPKEIPNRDNPDKNYPEKDPDPQKEKKSYLL